MSTREIVFGAAPRDVTVVVDTPGWFDRHAEELVERLRERGDRPVLTRTAEDIPSGGVAFLLSCMKLVPTAILERSTLTAVVHASALPHGRGFSPIVWQVLEGATLIPVTMIEAAAEADAGDILLQRELRLTGTELNDELRDRLGAVIVAMCLELLSSDRTVAKAQMGTATWYNRRRPEDSRLDPHKTIAEQFELLRVVDNERYPAFFDYRGARYTLRIEKSGEPSEPVDGREEPR